MFEPQWSYINTIDEFGEQLQSVLPLKVVDGWAEKLRHHSFTAEVELANNEIGGIERRQLLCLALKLFHELVCRLLAWAEGQAMLRQHLISRFSFGWKDFESSTFKQRASLHFVVIMVVPPIGVAVTIGLGPQSNHREFFQPITVNDVEFWNAHSPFSGDLTPKGLFCQYLEGVLTYS
jgi:hypothetical protein